MFKKSPPPDPKQTSGGAAKEKPEAPPFVRSINFQSVGKGRPIYSTPYPPGVAGGDASKLEVVGMVRVVETSLLEIEKGFIDNSHRMRQMQRVHEFVGALQERVEIKIAELAGEKDAIVCSFTLDTAYGSLQMLPQTMCMNVVTVTGIGTLVRIM